MMKRIISRGLYILDPTPPRSVACSGVTHHLGLIASLATPLSMLKKLCPWFSSLSSLDSKSCQFAKHHCLSSNPIVNK